MTFSVSKLKALSASVMILAALQQWGFCGNPIVKDAGMSDPHVRVFNDKIYLYCGHDSSPEDRTWIMKEWRIFSSSDLVEWKQEGTISPKDNYMADDSADCWAGDAATRNGSYYFYFSDQKRGVGVMGSDSPCGPFKDLLGKPLVAPMHDPTVLIDDDAARTPYLIYGDKAGGGFHIAELNEDMISLKESPKPISIIGKAWKKAPEWMDKNYVFKHNGVYYLSWGRDYATSENIYGPYECIGAVGRGHKLSEYAHGSFFEWNGQFYHIWCYYIKTGFKYRESIMTYCHFGRDGRIVTDTVFLDKHFATGVGQYDAAWPKIEAEWFYGKSADVEKEEIGANEFGLANITDDSWVLFANIAFADPASTVTACLSEIQGEGVLEIRTGSRTGTLAGSLAVTEIGTVSESVTIPSGKEDLYLVFQGAENFTCTLDWFTFASP